MNETIPKDILKIVLDYYLEDYTWYSIGFKKHRAHDNFKCCKECNSIINCKDSLYHNMKSFIANATILPSLKRICKYCNEYVTAWFQKNWRATTWKKLPYVQSMVKEFDKSDTKRICISYFEQLYGIINSHKSFSISKRSRRPETVAKDMYLFQIFCHDGKILCNSKYYHYEDMFHIYQLSIAVITEDSSGDLGWIIKERTDKYSYGYNFDICDALSFLQMPGFKNILRPEQFNLFKIRYKQSFIV